MVLRTRGLESSIDPFLNEPFPFYRIRFLNALALFSSMRELRSDFDSVDLIELLSYGHVEIECEEKESHDIEGPFHRGLLGENC